MSKWYRNRKWEPASFIRNYFFGGWTEGEKPLQKDMKFIEYETDIQLSNGRSITIIVYTTPPFTASKNYEPPFFKPTPIPQTWGFIIPRTYSTDLRQTKKYNEDFIYQEELEELYQIITGTNYNNFELGFGKTPQFVENRTIEYTPYYQDWREIGLTWIKEAFEFIEKGTTFYSINFPPGGIQ